MRLTLEIEGDFDPLYVEHLRAATGGERQMLMFPVAVSLARVERRIENYSELDTLPLGAIVQDSDDDKWKCHGEGGFVCEGAMDVEPNPVSEASFKAYGPWILLPETWS